MQLLSLHLRISIAIRVTKISRGEEFPLQTTFQMEQGGSFQNSSKSTSQGPEGQPGPGRYFHNLQVTAPVERFPGVLGRQEGAYQPNCGTNDKGMHCL